MQTRWICLRLLAMLAFISVTIRPGGIDALEDHTPISLSFLPMMYGECPWGSKLTDGQCQPIEVPAHTFLDSSGKYWACERGYWRSQNQCLPVEVPAHAFLDYSGHNWECERGYTRDGDRCVEVKVPAHAYLDYFGHDWVCDRGYKYMEDQCVPIELPAYAHLDYTGNVWACDRGFVRVNDACQPVWARLRVPEVQALALALSPEARSAVRQLQSQLKQAGYDPGSIDGVFGPKTLAALQHYMEAQEGALAKGSPTPSRETHGT